MGHPVFTISADTYSRLENILAETNSTITIIPDARNDRLGIIAAYLCTRPTGAGVKLVVRRIEQTPADKLMLVVMANSPLTHKLEESKLTDTIKECLIRAGAVKGWTGD